MKTIVRMASIQTTIKGGIDMTKDELITKQQLEIEGFKQDAENVARMKKDVYGQLYSIGAPLNDNCDGFNSIQRRVLHRIADILEIN